MESVQSAGWSRRKVVGGAALLAAAIGIPVALVRLDLLDGDRGPSDRQRSLMRAVSQHVIPATDTPGAGDVGVGDFVLLALAHGLEDARRPLAETAPAALLAHRRADGSIDHVAWLEAELDRRTGDFMGAPPEAQLRHLAAIDTEAYAPEQREHPWRTLKSLMLTGYYTSEVGGARELRFEPVPGRYDPDVPVTPATRAYSSDWTAVDFG